MKAFTLALMSGATSLAAAEPVHIEARATSSSSSSASASGTGSSSLPTITVNGNAFFAGDDRFYIKGVDYQPGGSSDVTDPLADYSTCSRDVEYFKDLGLNTIRVYTVDNSANHDECMNALAEAGIYLALDVNTPNYSLNRESPAEPYNPTYLQSVFATIDTFAGYTNTLLFFSGNEVINDSNSTSAAPYVKAVASTGHVLWYDSRICATFVQQIRPLRLCVVSMILREQGSNGERHISMWIVT